MIVNDNIKPRPLTEQELADRKRGVFDSYANYLVYCGKCGKMRKTNMYVMRAEAYIDELRAAGKTCPDCGGVISLHDRECSECQRKITAQAQRGEADEKNELA